jgi:hypothetical protein
MPSNVNFCTVSTFTGSETYLDSIVNGNMISDATLVITPDSGYVVSASDFNISGGTASSGTTFTHGVNGVTLPQNIGGVAGNSVDTVEFIDTGDAGIVGNTVQVKVNLGFGFVMPAGDIVIDIDINGNATTAGLIDFSITINSTFNTGVSGFTLETQDGISGLIGVEVDGMVPSTFTGTIGGASYNDSGTLIGSITFTAAPGSYIPLTTNFNQALNSDVTNPAIINIPGGSSDIISMYFAGQTLDDNGNVESITYSIVITPQDDYDIPTGFYTGIYIDGTADPVPALEINNTTISGAINSMGGESIYDLTGAGGLLEFNVLGDDGATFNYTITNTTTSTEVATGVGVVALTDYDFTNPITNITTTYQTSFTLFNYTLPVLPTGTHVYTVLIEPTGDTIINQNDNYPTDPVGNILYTFTQYADSAQMELRAIQSGSDFTATSVTATGGGTGVNEKLILKSKKKSLAKNYKWRNKVVNNFSWDVYKEGGGNVNLKPGTYISSVFDVTNTGGAEYTLTNLVASGSGTAKLTLTGTLIMKKYGTENLVLELDLVDVCSV